MKKFSSFIEDFGNLPIIIYYKSIGKYFDFSFEKSLPYVLEEINMVYISIKEFEKDIEKYSFIKTDFDFIINYLDIFQDLVLSLSSFEELLDYFDYLKFFKTSISFFKFFSDYKEKFQISILGNVIEFERPAMTEDFYKEINNFRLNTLKKAFRDVLFSSVSKKESLLKGLFSYGTHLSVSLEKNSNSGLFKELLNLSKVLFVLIFKDFEISSDLLDTVRANFIF